MERVSALPKLSSSIADDMRYNYIPEAMAGRIPLEVRRSAQGRRQPVCLPIYYL